MATKKKWIEFVKAVRAVERQADSHPQAYVAYHGIACGYLVDDEPENWKDQCVRFTCGWDGAEFMDDHFDYRSTSKDLDAALAGLQAVVPVKCLPNVEVVRRAVAKALVEFRGKNLGAADAQERALAEELAWNIVKGGK